MIVNLVVVLCCGYSPEFLVERTVWTKLELPVDRDNTNMADSLINRRILHWSMGIIPPCHRYPIKETFMDSTCLCNWSRRPKMVSDALGNNIYRT